MKSWEDVAGRPARVVRSYSISPDKKAASLGRRVTRPGPGETWAGYTPKNLPRRPLHVVANDNKPRQRATAVPLPAYRCERQEPPREAPTPMRVRLNLQKTAPDQYRTFVRVKELLRPTHLLAHDAILAADNDNKGFGIDHRHHITPGNEGMDDLLVAYADGMRSRVVVDRKGSVDLFVGGVKFHCDCNGTNEIVEIGGRSTHGRFFGMRLYRGKLIDYAKDGKRIKPDYRLGYQRGSEDEAWTPHITTATPARHSALSEIDRSAQAAVFAEEIGPAAMRRLRLILEADSFAEIGKAYGYAESAAHRHGRRVTIQALKDADEKLAA